MAKLIFRISVDNAEEPVAVERMWVVVRERVGDPHFGILDNQPAAIAENDELWTGRDPSVRDLLQVAERSWTDTCATRSAFAWGELTAESPERLLLLRAAHAALRGDVPD